MYTEEEPKNGGLPRATESQEGNAGCVVAAQGLGWAGCVRCAAGWGSCGESRPPRGAVSQAGLFGSRQGNPRGAAERRGGAERMAPGARGELLGRGPRTYVCAPWGGTGRVHGTGRRRASACARFRAPLRRGPAPPGEDAAQTRDRAGRRNGGERRRLRRPESAALSHSGQKRGGERPRESSARLSAPTGKERRLQGEARVRGA